VRYAYGSAEHDAPSNEVLAYGSEVGDGS